MTVLEERAIDPSDPGDRRDYLHGLTTSFGHWGDETTFAWAFQRECGGPPADLVVLHEGARAIAGSAISYRRVALGTQPRLAAIMTGSWTLPEARGRGCFSRIVDWSVRTAERRGAALLVAFVTEDNPSCRRLQAAGAAGVETSYLLSSDETPAPAAGCEESRPLGDVDPWTRLHAVEQAGAVSSFVYPDREAWLGQFVRRPEPVEVVDAGGTTVLVERAARSDRVLLAPVVDAAAARRALAALWRSAFDGGRQLFCFSTQPAWRDAALALGLRALPGRMTILPAKAAPSGTWRVHGGDRM